MFDIGWSELMVIGVVALIAIGPKELPGVLRMIGQWMGKARRMASEFQGHFNEAMREAEMTDLKKTFDDVRDAAKGYADTNLMKPLASAEEAARFDLTEPVMPTTPADPTPETFIEAEAHQPAPEMAPAESSAPLDLAPPAQSENTDPVQKDARA